MHVDTTDLFGVTKICVTFAKIVRKTSIKALQMAKLAEVNFEGLETFINLARKLAVPTFHLSVRTSSDPSNTQTGLTCNSISF